MEIKGSRMLDVPKTVGELREILAAFPAGSEIEYDNPDNCKLVFVLEDINSPNEHLKLTLIEDYHGV